MNSLNELRRIIVALWNLGVIRGRNAWTGANIAARWVVLVTVLWPLLVTVVAFIGSTWFTATICLLPLIAMAVLLFIWDHPAMVPVLALFPRGRSLLRGILGFLGAQLAIGLYATVIPIKQRPTLVPLLILASLALAFIIVSEGTPVRWKKWAKAGAAMVVILVTIAFFIPRTSQKVWGLLDFADKGVAKAMDGLSTGDTEASLTCGRGEGVPLKKEVTFTVPSASAGTPCKTGWISRPYGAPGFLVDVLSGKLDVEIRLEDGTYPPPLVDYDATSPDAFPKGTVKAFRFTNKGTDVARINFIMMR